MNKFPSDQQTSIALHYNVTFQSFSILLNGRNYLIIIAST